MAEKVLSIRDLFAPGFWKVWNAVYRKLKTTFCLAGGRGSTKSAFVAFCIFLILEMDRRIALERKRLGDTKWRSYLSHAIVYRKVANTLADSVYTEMQRAAQKLNLTDKYIFKKTPLMIERRGTGQRILFRGLDDPQRSKSLKAPFGWFKVLHFEELAEFDGIEEVLDVQRSIQRGGHEFVTFMSYNPPETSANWVNYTMQQMADKDPLFGFYLSDYRTVPKEWLGEEFFRQAELLRLRNERQYRHVYLGEVTGNGGTVFPNVKECSLTDEQIKSFDNVMWGCDFGLRDPTVLCGVYYDSLNHALYCFDEVYKSDMTLDEMEKEFKKHHFGYEYIVADCAGATLIQTLRARGLDMIPCKKGNSSILNGIKWLQSLSAIYIDRKRCPNAWREFTQYEYEKNKAGEFTGRLPDKNNHYIDGVRYATEKTASTSSWF